MYETDNQNAKSRVHHGKRTEKSRLFFIQAFKKAWKWVKFSVTICAAGTTFGNRQECLNFLKQFKQDDLSATLKREPDNEYDSSAIQIVVHIHPISKRTVIGYVPKELACELAKVIDTGIQGKASLMQIIGRYSYKETFSPAKCI